MAERVRRERGTGPGASPHLVTPDEAGSLHGLLRARVARTPDAPAYEEFRDGSWRRLTWRETLEQVGRYQAALHRSGVEPGDRVALRAKNRMSWVFFEQAALALGCVLVPLYVMDRARNVAWIIGNANARVLMLDDAAMWEDLLPYRELMPELETVIVLDAAGENAPPDTGTVSAWLDGAGAPPAPHEPGRDELATIIYTSGTTGRPKGVMLSHRNILDNGFNGQRRLPIVAEERLLSFLPLCHALERTSGYYVPMMAGACVAFARSITDLPEDLLAVRPTCIITVPRIFERVHRRVIDEVGASAIKRGLFGAAVAVGWSRFLRRQGRGPWRASHLLGPILDRLVASKVRARLGGRLWGALCGGASLRFDVARTMVAFGIEISHAYGLTECSPGITLNGASANRPETVGPPMPETTVRIASDGELCVRSTSVMLGYWRNEDATREVLDEEGWLHTGDLARLDGGFVVITGRKKEIIVLATGTKVPPGDIEESILKDSLFEQVLLVGEGRPYLSLLVHVDRGTWRRETRGRLPDDPVTEDPEIEGFLLERVSARLGAFTGHARVRRITVIGNAWTAEDGLLTPTLKPRRARIEEAHAAQIERMYQVAPTRPA